MARNVQIGFEPIPFGRYVLLDRIGKGGMAEIFRAIAGGFAGFRKLIAVKRILAHLAEDESFREMFINEAKLAALLEHPNVVQIFDLGEIEGQLFLAMEYVAGLDLGRILKLRQKQRKPLPLDISLFIVSEFLRGLDYAHNREDPTTGDPLHLIHRDVSPPNVLVSFEGVVKLGDFGIAKAQTASPGVYTRTGSVKGKVPYMSPELVGGDPPDHRSDIWAAGVVLWESLALRRLFKGTNDFELINKIQAGNVRPIEEVRPDLPPAVVQIVRHALTIDRSQRYQTAGDMANAITDTAAQLGHVLNANALRAFMHQQFLEEVTEIKSFAKKLDEFLSQTPTPTPQSGPSRTPPASGPGAGQALTLGRRLRWPVVTGAAGAALLAVGVLAGVLAPEPQPPSLVIETKPSGAAILLEGSQLPGLTPFRTDRLPPGDYAIELRLPGHKHQVVTASLSEGQEKMLSLVMEPEESIDFGLDDLDSKDPDAGSGQPDAAEATEQPDKPDKPKVVRGYGTIDITAVPWAYITIDGHRLSRPTPIIKYKIRAGSHTIEAQNPNLKKRKRKKITVKTNGNTKVTFKFK